MRSPGSRGMSAPLRRRLNLISAVWPLPTRPPGDGFVNVPPRASYSGTATLGTALQFAQRPCAVGSVRAQIQTNPWLAAEKPPIAVVGSGPAGLINAYLLAQEGFPVTVFEAFHDLGGVLRYGIPEFKLEKSVLDRRLDVMMASGVSFHTNVTVGASATSLDSLRHELDAVLLAIGSTRPRLIPVAGAELEGVYPAMTFLEAANRAVRDGVTSPIDAKGRHVIILGGGDTGADCLGTVHRQGAASVVQIEILDRPPDERPSDQPWPTMARIFKSSPAHEEGGERKFSTETLEFLGVESVSEITVRDATTGDAHSMPAHLVLIAAGFVAS